MTKKTGGKTKNQKRNRWKYKQQTTQIHKKKMKCKRISVLLHQAIHFHQTSPYLAFLVCTLDSEDVLLLTVSYLILCQAKVDSIIRFVERLKMQESAIHFCHWGELSILLLPNIGPRPKLKRILTFSNGIKLSTAISLILTPESDLPETIKKRQGEENICMIIYIILIF